MILKKGEWDLSCTVTICLNKLSDIDNKAHLRQAEILQHSIENLQIKAGVTSSNDINRKSCS